MVRDQLDDLKFMDAANVLEESNGDGGKSADDALQGASEIGDTLKLKPAIGV